MKEPLDIKAAPGGSLTACALQALYWHGVMTEEEALQTHAHVSWPASGHPDDELDMLRTALEYDLYMYMVSPLNPYEIAHGDGLASAGRDWGPFDDETAVSLKAQALHMLDIMSDHDAQVRSEVRTASLDDLRRHLNLDAAVLLRNRQTASWMLAMFNGPDACWLFRPEFGTTAPMQYAELWESIIHEIIAINTHPYSGPAMKDTA